MGIRKTEKEKKYKMFVRAWREGNSDEQLSRIFHLSMSTVRRWKVEPPGVAGRPPSEARQARIRTAVRLARRKTVVRTKSGFRLRPDFPTCEAVARELQREFGHFVSAETVRKDLMSVGVVSRRRIRHPNLSNASKRLAYAKRMLLDEAFMKAIVFSDEHTISTNDSSSQTQLVKAGHQPFPREIQRIQNVPCRMVFGLIGWNYKPPLVVLPKKDPDDPKGQKAYRLNALRYQQVCLAHNLRSLVSKCPNRRQRVFMQDGAKCHTAKQTLMYLKRHGVLLVEGHPASSPDLNPIECVWSELNRRISLLEPYDDDSLVAAAHAAWDSFTLAEINAYVFHFATACRTVVANRGC